MKTLIFTLVLSLFLIATTSHAQGFSAPIRQATIRVVIQKKTFVADQDGPPRFEQTPVCTKQALIDVYQAPYESLSLSPDVLSLVQCDAQLFGAPVSVVVGGFVNLYQDTSITGGSLAMKGTSLILSWGNRYSETPKISHPSAADPWIHFTDVLSPIATGKIVDGVPQPPEPREFFLAIVTIIDAP